MRRQLKIDLVAADEGPFALALLDRWATREQLDHLIHVDLINPRRAMSSKLRGAAICCACKFPEYGFPTAWIPQSGRDPYGSWFVEVVILAMADDGRLFIASYYQILPDEELKDAFIINMMNDPDQVHDFAARGCPNETYFGTWQAAADEGTA